MTRREISQAVGNISARHIQEAAQPGKALSCQHGFFKNTYGRAAIAAVLALCLLLGGIGIFGSGGMSVTAYAYGAETEITTVGTTLSTGLIRNSGEMTGHPLMFYLSGKDIATVRFSCKNQQISFMDWTEQREEYGLAQNFTVSYGKDESEYAYLLIDWVPNATIRALTDHAETTIATLPVELREDIIVMEITFANGKTMTKAITVSLENDGTICAALDAYTITPEDTFVRRADASPIPRTQLYQP